MFSKKEKIVYLSTGLGYGCGLLASIVFAFFHLKVLTVVSFAIAILSVTFWFVFEVVFE